MSVEVGVVVGQEGVVVGFRVGVRVSRVVERDEPLLFLRFSDVFDGVARPDLSFLHDSSRRHHAVRSDDRTFLYDCALHDD